MAADVDDIDTATDDAAAVLEANAAKIETSRVIWSTTERRRILLLAFAVVQVFIFVRVGRNLLCFAFPPLPKKGATTMDDGKSRPDHSLSRFRHVYLSHHMYVKDFCQIPVLSREDLPSPKFNSSSKLAIRYEMMYTTLYD